MSLNTETKAIRLQTEKRRKNSGLDMVTHTYNLSTQEVKAGRSRLLGHPRLHNDL